MNLRTQITNKLLELLFNGEHEYIPDCEDAALEIMKLIAAEKEPSDDDVGATVNELRNLAGWYNDLMEERERAENGEGERSVERIDEAIDELLGETMAVTRRLLCPESEPEQEPVSEDSKKRAELSAKIIEFVDGFDSSGEDVSEMSPEDIDQLSTWAVQLASLCSVHIVPSSDKE